MKILLTGASGFVGRHLCQYLAEEGHEVIALSRSGKAPTGQKISPVAGDVVSGEGLSEAARGVDAVMHLVGIIREQADATFERVHVEGAERVLAACREAGVERYLHMSALGVDSGVKSRYFTSKLEAEGLVKASGLRWTIFRPSLTFGVGDDFYSKILKGLVADWPVIPQIGDGHFLFRPIWIGDVARAFSQSLERPETEGRIITLVGPKEYRFSELLRLVRDALGSKKPIVPVPVSLVSLGVPLIQLLPKPLITRDQFAMLLAGNTGDPREAEALFDLSKRPLEAELPAMLGAH